MAEISENEALIRKAEADGKWLWCRYYGLWLSPAMLRERQAKNELLIRSDSWELRDPLERLQALKDRERLATEERESFERALGIKKS